ncbi:MATE family efflux transporter [Cutibacterium sp. WCA-380-WT-3A]|uniref:MATE family efflux transporter n=1 Tax=Cutibacterium porci TaxID=2605781 RepID=A0A7K0J3Q1_9ACTN|nr:MATE family efflux transporter [Cutibacterium porci]MSS44560.1 MATE family efflux transporter [Cutibacterium porci]
MVRGDPSAGYRQILNLAVPAFLSLIAEPLFLVADSAVVGHLGTEELAGLGVASAALTTFTGLFVFLAYATTATSSRRMGAGDQRGAAQTGVDGLWLSVIIGVLVAVMLVALPVTVAGWFGASGAVAEQAGRYLRITGFGVPAMLATMAVTGVLRGFQDTRTPLVVTVVTFSANLVLNVWFVIGLGWGIQGSAIGTLVCQIAMAVALVSVLRVRTRGFDLSLMPRGITSSLRDGIPLLIRTLALRAALYVTTWVAARSGAITMASYQVTMTIWNLLLMAMDALGIAGQALTGASLGAGDTRRTRSLTATMTRWGLIAGVVVGVLLLAFHQLLPALYTDDPAVHRAVAAGLLVVAAQQIVAGPTFVLDGVLIGAGDGRWLSGAQVVMFLVYLPMVWAVHLWAPSDPAAAVVWLWVAFSGFMVVRCVILTWRAHGDAWMRTGA